MEGTRPQDLICLDSKSGHYISGFLFGKFFRWRFLDILIFDHIF